MQTMLVIFDQKGNMLQQSPRPDGIRRFGEVYPVFLKKLFVVNDKAPVDIKKTTAGSHGECLDMAIETGRLYCREGEGVPWEGGY